MSLFALVIAIAHGLPPILGALIIKSKNGVFWGSLIAVIIAIAAGNPLFIIIDMIGVVFGTWLAIKFQKRID